MKISTIDAFNRLDDSTRLAAWLWHTTVAHYAHAVWDWHVARTRGYGQRFRGSALYIKVANDELRLAGQVRQVLEGARSTVHDAPAPLEHPTSFNAAHHAAMSRLILQGFDLRQPYYLLVEAVRFGYDHRIRGRDTTPF